MMRDMRDTKDEFTIIRYPITLDIGIDKKYKLMYQGELLTKKFHSWREILMILNICRNLQRVKCVDTDAIYVNKEEINK